MVPVQPGQQSQGSCPVQLTSRRYLPAHVAWQCLTWPGAFGSVPTQREAVWSGTDGNSRSSYRITWPHNRTGIDACLNAVYSWTIWPTFIQNSHHVGPNSVVGQISQYAYIFYLPVAVWSHIIKPALLFNLNTDSSLPRDRMLYSFTVEHDSKEKSKASRVENSEMYQ